MIAPHPLKAWIDANSSQAQFARSVECSESHLSDLLAGKKRPSLDLALRMSRETGGAVSVDEIASRMPVRTAGSSAEASAA
jgi:plasmid maintenance system antidote protein VapI